MGFAFPEPRFAPGPVAARRSLVACADLQPMLQGEFDGLCAVYAVVNGLRLLLARDRPIEYSECEALFRRAVTYLATEERLSATINWGASIPLWRELIEHVVGAARYLTGRRITASFPFGETTAVGPTELGEVLEWAVAAQQPALIMWRRRRSHFTVVAGHTPAHLLLFDSGGRKRLRRSAYDTILRPRVRYQLPQAALALLDPGLAR